MLKQAYVGSIIGSNFGHYEVKKKQLTTWAADVDIHQQGISLHTMQTGESIMDEKGTKLYIQFNYSHYEHFAVFFPKTKQWAKLNMQ